MAAIVDAKVRGRPPINYNIIVTGLRQALKTSDGVMYAVKEIKLDHDNNHDMASLVFTLSMI